MCRDQLDKILFTTGRILKRLLKYNLVRLGYDRGKNMMSEQSFNLLVLLLVSQLVRTL